MKEIYNSAARKLKRVSFLASAVDAKNAEIAANREKIAVLRKKNGRENRAENDVKIYNLNALVSDAEKSVRAAKAEIKTLRERATEELITAYPLAKTDEHRNKVRLAVSYATENAYSVCGAEDVGGVFGETEIIGVTTTSDRKLRGNIAEEKRAGLKDKDGNVTTKPRVVAYFYTKKEPEGIYRDADDKIKPVLKKQTKNGFFNYLKEAYGNKNTLFTLFFAAIYCVFAVWSAIGGFGERVFPSAQKTLPAAVFVGAAVYLSVSLFSDVKGGYSDNFALLCVMVSAVGFGCLPAYSDKFRAAIFPAAAFVLGIAYPFIRAKINEKQDFPSLNTPYSSLFALFGGIITGFTVNISRSAGLSFFLPLFILTAAICLFAAVMAFAGKKTGFCMKILLSGSAEFAVLTVSPTERYVTVAAFCALAVCAAVIIIYEIRKINIKRINENKDRT
ncbi:MAG TPA: hypothetical protein DDW54_03210 [Clostridiales bacterium]|nr:hypothetical protein [Clostridiales bacterium]